MINWEEVARSNGLTIEEFKKEVFSCAACIGAMVLDEKDSSDVDTLRFTCSDDVGKIELLIKRVL